MLERLGVKRVLGLTATATHETAVSVARCFNINPSNGIIRDGSILPSNLRITVSCESNKHEVCNIVICNINWYPCSHFNNIVLVGFGQPTQESKICQFWISDCLLQ